MKCPECNSFMDLHHNIRHNKDGRWYYRCTNYRYCNASHGAHQDTLKPLGKPADKKTRRARQIAHIMLDGYREQLGCKRSTIYKRLAKVMGLSRRTAHIAHFSLKQCQELYEHIERGRL
jgi:ssDNA-binding Zn-finger/Zn-ribbon topoisomerase 1